MNYPRTRVLPPGIYENQGGVPLGPAIPPGFSPGPPDREPVQVIEPTTGWWKRAGRLGQRFQGFVPRREGDVIGLTDEPNLPGPPAPWWFSFFRFNRNQGTEASNQGNWEFRGRIIYGVGGIQNTIDVDLVQGIQFPLVCNSATVQLVTLNPYADGVLNPYDPGDKKVTAGVMLGKGGGSGRLPVTFSTQWMVAPGGGVGFSQTTLIPDFARSVAVHCSSTLDTTLDGIAITFVDLGGQALASLSMDPDLSYNVLTQEGGVPIPFGANAVILTGDTSTPAGTTAQLQFFLAL